MVKFLLILFCVCCVLHVGAQNNNGSPVTSQTVVQRPKLVIGIVVDQMRWDYLYRYYSRYSNNGGFKRLLRNGFSCQNTMIPYVPTVTACGHTCIYTGSVPAINGITGNEWWDYDLSKAVYCTGDDQAKTIGSTTTAGQMSPRNLLVTTIGDELRLATNFHSKVIGIALKDRAAILPAGHSANAAYWYDGATGNWISSSYYINELPKWVQDLNAKKLPDQYYSNDWNTLYPLDTYIQSAPDEEPYEYRPFGRTAKGFPYNLKPFIGKNYDILHVTPYGNSFTFDMAKAAINGEQLGAGSFTDMLTISLSTPDYIGHSFGPNSVEAEDDFLRLDKDLGSFLDFLDEKIGKGNYLVFFTADHGVAQVPFFLNQHKIPSGNAVDAGYADELNTLLKSKFGADKLLIDVSNYQVHIDRNLEKHLGLNKDSVNKTVINYLLGQPGVYRAFALDKLNEITLNATIKADVTNGYYPQRSGDIQIIFKPQWIEGFEEGGTTHGEWNPYDSHIPLIWYGWNIKPGQTSKEVYMTDIAPTVSTMLHIQVPSGSIGHVIEQVSP
jgi:predicted AlkP superfamily pyrophosphatase or phosphodiesterase